MTRLARWFDIELVAVSKVPDADFSSLFEATDRGITARVFPVQAQSTGLGLSPHEARHSSPSARAYLASKQFTELDVVHVEGHYLIHLLPERLRRIALLVEHNVESQLFEQWAMAGLTGALKDTALGDAAMTRRAEQRAWRSVASVATLTGHDAEQIRRVAPDVVPRTLPVGADHLARASSPGGGSGRDLVYIGNFGYQPSEDAVYWLVSEILPAIAVRRPDVRLTIVGHSPPPWLSEIGHADPRVIVTGWVPDVVPYLDAAGVVVCPLRVGGGVKVKVLEALMRGCAVVTTPVGGQGLQGFTPNALVICTTTDELVDRCVRLMGSPGERRRQQRCALRAAAALPTWDDAAAAVARVWISMSVDRPSGFESVVEA